MKCDWSAGRSSSAKMALAGHSGMHTAQSMHSSGSMTRKFGPSRKQSTGHTSPHNRCTCTSMQFSVTTWVMAEVLLCGRSVKTHAILRFSPPRADRGQPQIRGRGSYSVALGSVHQHRASGVVAGGVHQDQRDPRARAVGERRSGNGLLQQQAPPRPMALGSSCVAASWARVLMLRLCTTRLDLGLRPSGGRAAPSTRGRRTRGSLSIQAMVALGCVCCGQAGLGGGGVEVIVGHGGWARGAATIQSPRETSTSRSSVMPADRPGGHALGRTCAWSITWADGWPAGRWGRICTWRAHLGAAGGHTAPEHAAALGGDGAVVELLHPLHRGRPGQIAVGRGAGQLLQQLQQAGAVCSRTSLRGHRPRCQPLRADTGTVAATAMPASWAKRSRAARMSGEGQGRVGHGVQLVDGKHQRVHAQQVHQQAVAARLRQQVPGWGSASPAWWRPPAPRRRRRCWRP